MTAKELWPNLLERYCVSRRNETLIQRSGERESCSPVPLFACVDHKKLCFRLLNRDLAMKVITDFKKQKL